MKQYKWKVGDVFKTHVTTYQVLSVDENRDFYLIHDFKDHEDGSSRKDFVVTLEMLAGFTPLSPEEKIMVLLQL